MEDCHFLSVLPPELRIHIYELTLSFSKPLKLRQWQRGSENASILRTNMQIYKEALPVFYYCNTIIASRNDFCLDTDPDLQTPVRKDQVRHLLFRNFTSSIRCSPFVSRNDEWRICCRVCQPSATGFITTLAELPKLQSVIIDYRHQPKEFHSIKKAIRGIGKNSVDAMYGFRLTCTDIAQYRLTSPSVLSNLNITFTDITFNTIWNQFISFGCMLDVDGIRRGREQDMLNRLRTELDRDVPDKLYLLHCGQHSVHWMAQFERVYKLWAEVHAAQSSRKDASNKMEALTEDVKKFCDPMTAGEARKQLELLRYQEASRALLVHCQKPKKESEENS